MSRFSEGDAFEQAHLNWRSLRDDIGEWVDQLKNGRKTYSEYMNSGNIREEIFRKRLEDIRGSVAGLDSRACIIGYLNTLEEEGCKWLEGAIDVLRKKYDDSHTVVVTDHTVPLLYADEYSFDQLRQIICRIFHKRILNRHDMVRGAKYFGIHENWFDFTTPVRSFSALLETHDGTMAPGAYIWYRYDDDDEIQHVYDNLLYGEKPYIFKGGQRRRKKAKKASKKRINPPFRKRKCEIRKSRRKSYVTLPHS